MNLKFEKRQELLELIMECAENARAQPIIDFFEQRPERVSVDAVVMEPEAFIVNKPGKRSVVDAKKYRADKAEFWIDGQIPNGCSVVPLYPGEKITEVT